MHIYIIPCAHVSIYIYTHVYTCSHNIYIYIQYIDYLWFWNMLMIVINRSSAKLAFGHHPKSRLQNRGVTEIDWDVAARVFSWFFESVKSCAASDWCFAAFLRPKHGIPLKLFQTLLYPNNWPSSGPTFNTLYAINMLYCECMTLKLWRIAITFNHPYHHTHSSTI